MLLIVSSVLVGTLLSGIWFGLNVVVNIIAGKLKVDWLARYSVLFSALLPTLLILSNSSLELWNIASFTDKKNWLLILATVLITSIIAAKNSADNLMIGKELINYALDGVFMEVPQRIMMQSFMHMMLCINEKNVCWTPILTAIVWCISICIQCVIMKQNFGKSVICDLLASFIFSVGVGYVLMETGFIGFTMIAHFMERLVSTFLRKWMARR